MLGAVRPLMFALGVAVVAAGAPARAEGTDAAAAEQLFMAGRAAMEKGDYKSACDRFAESERLDPAAGTLINLADCLDRAGKIASAWQRWKEALDMLRADDERRTAVTQRAAAIESRVPKLEIRLASSAPPETTVERDDVALGAASLGLSLPIDPGSHRIVAKAPGRAPRQYPLTIKESESSTLEVEPGTPVTPESRPASSPAIPSLAEPPPEQGGASARRTWGFVGLGVGIAGLVVGGTAGVLAIVKKQEVDDDCHRLGGNLLCHSQAGVDAAQAGGTFATVANIGMAVGLVGVVAGGYLLLTSSKGASTSAYFRGAPSGATAGVTHWF